MLGSILGLVSIVWNAGHAHSSALEPEHMWVSCPQPLAVQRFSVDSLNKTQLKGLLDKGPQMIEPLILTDLVKNWRASNWTEDHYRQWLGRFDVFVIRGSLAQHLTVSSFLDTWHKSTPDGYVYFINEGLLAELLPGRQWPLLHDATPNPLLDLDMLVDHWSNHFGLMALTMGGAGARSNLHVDMYNWTGWHALLSGIKVWRFLPKWTNLTELGTVKKKDIGNIIHDYVSDVDLFAKPGCALSEEPTVDARRPDLERHPSSARLLQQAIEVVQRPGEVILLPSSMWHQAYYAEASVGISGQFVSDENIPTMLWQVLHYAYERGGIDFNNALQACTIDVASLVPAEQLDLVYDCLVQLGWEDEYPPLVRTEDEL